MSHNTETPIIAASQSIGVGSFMTSSFLPSSTKIVLLERTNYILLESQITPILKYHRLYKYLDDSYETPAQELVDAVTEEKSPNPAYEEWEVIDQTIMSWINCSLTETMKSECARRGNSRVIKEISDSLAAVLQPVYDLELVSTTLRGLGADYTSIYTTVIARTSRPTFTEHHALLLHHESHLQYLRGLETSASDLQNSNAFFAGSQYSGLGQSSNHVRGSFNGRGNWNSTGNGRGRTNWNTNVRPNWNSNGRGN
ncbi:uncharacterized protein LOC113324865 [Papaver somniferum]|uniref:uncharacterized protein LOC113324865 n=1 Tax=Papaver somniferum TaxID=3469 RepID=UPI000E6FD6B0|nr:uncharacterized protein LOC113324865 [Papaver somniferum]